MVNWAAGVTLLWILAMTLWLPWLDTGKSYRSTVLDLKQHLPQQYRCIAGAELDDVHRAMLQYFGDITPRRLRVPEALVERMRAAPCLRLELPLEARVELLMQDYDFFVRDTETFCTRLDALRVLRGHETVNGWQAQARAGHTREVVRDLLVAHYDPIYRQSMQRNFAGLAAPLATIEWDGSDASLDAAVRRIAAL